MRRTLESLETDWLVRFLPQVSDGVRMSLQAANEICFVPIIAVLSVVVRLSVYKPKRILQILLQK